MREPARHTVHHLGRLGELVPIILVNVLLQVVTLGMYRFWAITRIRHYLWERTLFDDDPLEYTGTGKELFLGFLVGWVVIMIPMTIAQFAMATQRQELQIAGIVLNTIVFMVLAPIALYRARRYRLSRTVWRGIRWGQDGSQWAYAARWLGYGVVTLATLGLTYPLQALALERYRMNHTYFGDQPFHFDAGAGPLFRRWVKVWATAAFVTVAVAAVAITTAHRRQAGMFKALPPEAAVKLWGLALVVLVPAVLFLIGAWCWYKAAELRYIAENTSYQGMRFSCTVTGRQLAWLAIGNLLIRVLSLGLAAPYTLVRSARLMARTVSAQGDVDFRRVTQNADPRSKTGEGLATVLQMGEF